MAPRAPACIPCISCPFRITLAGPWWLPLAPGGHGITCPSARCGPGPAFCGYPIPQYCHHRLGVRFVHAQSPFWALARSPLGPFGPRSLRPLSGFGRVSGASTPGGLRALAHTWFAHSALPAFSCTPSGGSSPGHHAGPPIALFCGGPWSPLLALFRLGPPPGFAFGGLFPLALAWRPPSPRACGPLGAHAAVRLCSCPFGAHGGAFS